MKSIKSKLGTLNLRDVARGAIMAGGMLVLVSAEQSLESGHVPTQVELLLSLKIAIGTMLVYILKNFLTNSEDKLLKKETTE